MSSYPLPLILVADLVDLDQAELDELDDEDRWSGDQAVVIRLGEYEMARIPPRDLVRHGGDADVEETVARWLVRKLSQ